MYIFFFNYYFFKQYLMFQSTSHRHWTKLQENRVTRFYFISISVESIRLQIEWTIELTEQKK